MSFGKHASVVDSSGQEPSHIFSRKSLKEFIKRCSCESTGKQNYLNKSYLSATYRIVKYFLLCYFH